MTETLATETTAAAVEAPPSWPLALPLETQSGNERMRHVPSMEWVIYKVDVELRKRITTIVPPLTSVHGDDPRHATIDAALRNLGRALDRLADVARHTRGNGHAPNDHQSRLVWALDHAVTNLRSVDATLFGRRCPYHLFEKSKGEPLYAALLVVMQHVERLTTIARTIDPALDERLLEGLVRLQQPLREQKMA